MLDPIIRVFNDGLQALYGLTGSYTVSIILLTAVIRLVLHPLTRKQLNSMKAMQALAPQVEVLKRKYKDDPRQMQTEMMGLYRANRINPLGGCLPLLLQFPVLIALYRVFAGEGGFANETLLGLELSKAPTIALITQNPLLIAFPLLNAGTSYLQQQISITDPQQAKMFLFMPLFVAWISVTLPVALSVYWIASSILYVAEYVAVVGLPKKIGVAPPKSERRGQRSKAGTDPTARKEP